jgi:hypothetical protein
MEKKDIVKILNKGKEYILKEENKALWSNEDFVKEAINVYGGICLSYASNKLRNNKEIVKLAISINADSFRYASVSLRNDEEIFKYAIENKIVMTCLKNAGEDIRSNEEIMLPLCIDEILYFNICSSSLRKDKQFTMKVLEKNDEAVYYMDQSFFNDKDVVLLATKVASYSVFDDVSNDLLRDNEFMIKVFEYCMQDRNSDKRIPSKVFLVNKDISEAMQKFDKNLWNHISKRGTSRSIVVSDSSLTFRYLIAYLDEKELKENMVNSPINTQKNKTMKF